MHFVGKGGEQHPWRLTRHRNAADRVAQHHLHRLGVEVLLEDFEPALGPGLADQPVQWRADPGHEPRQSHVQHRLRQAGAQQIGPVGSDEIEKAVQFGLFGRRVIPAAGGDDRHAGQRLQLFGRQGDQLARAVTGIHQPANDAQALDLLERIRAFTKGIAARLRKSVTPLPDAQGVLGQTGVALDGSDAQGDRHRGREVVHGVRQGESGGWRDGPETRKDSTLAASPGFVQDKYLTTPPFVGIIG